jgi:O-glycosyl hydrolase
VNAFRERTPKYFAFKQFSRFISPGFIRLETAASDVPLVAAFRSPDARRVVIVCINPNRVPRAVTPRITPAAQLTECWLTDRQHQCAAANWTGTLPAESVCTLICQLP